METPAVESTPSHPRFTYKEIEALEEPSVQAEVIFCGGGSSHLCKFSIWLHAIPKFIFYVKITSWDFSGSPVVKILCFHCKGCGFNSWSGN